MMGSLGFHLSSSMSPSRDMLSRKSGLRDVEDRSLCVDTANTQNMRRSQAEKHTHDVKVCREQQAWATQRDMD